MEEDNIFPLPDQIYEKIPEDIKISYEPRKLHNLINTRFTVHIDNFN